jgi:hypothetical protein
LYNSSTAGARFAKSPVAHRDASPPHTGVDLEQHGRKLFQALRRVDFVAMGLNPSNG